MIKLFTYIPNDKELDIIKFSADPDDSSYTVGLGHEIFIGTPDISYHMVAFIPELNCIWSRGQFFARVDLSNLVTQEDLESVEESVNSSIKKGTLGKINNISIEDGNDVLIDLSLYKVVSSLPTEDIQDNKIYLVRNSSSTSTKNVFDEYAYVEESWEYLGQVSSEVDLTDYLKSVDAEKLYMKKTTGSAAVSTSSNGSMNNYTSAGQAFNAVREVTASVTGKDINAAAFGVKLDGTCAFSHKTYNTFDKTTGNSTGARNTAVLTFSGLSGLRYAKNTNASAADVSEDMYRYVGVIDSQDERQRVYSAKQVDDLLAARDAEIQALKDAIAQLTA